MTCGFGGKAAALDRLPLFRAWGSAARLARGDGQGKTRVCLERPQTASRAMGHTVGRGSGLARGVTMAQKATKTHNVGALARVG
jgi:hypothetical protein